MKGGSIFAALFFGLLFFAAFLSAVAAFEVLVTTAVDNPGGAAAKPSWCSARLRCWPGRWR